MIDICAIGPLRVTSGLYNAGLLQSGAKVSSQIHQKTLKYTSTYFIMFVYSYFTLFI